MQDVLPPSIHPDTGTPYAWLGDFTAIPVIPSAIYALWQSLLAEPGSHDTRRARQSHSRASDPIYQALLERELVIRDRRDGGIDIVCPFADEHTGSGGKGECVYYPLHTGGFATPKIHCLHSHCEHRTLDEYRHALDLNDRARPSHTENYAGGLAPKALEDFYHYAPDYGIMGDCVR